MKESERTINQSNAFVHILEQTYLEYLAHMAQVTEHKAHGRREGGCGCPSCKKQAEAWLERFIEESDRVNIWTPDMEEEWLTNYIIDQKLLGANNG